MTKEETLGELDRKDLTRTIIISKKHFTKKRFFFSSFIISQLISHESSYRVEAFLFIYLAALTFAKRFSL